MTQCFAVKFKACAKEDFSSFDGSTLNLSCIIDLKLLLDLDKTSFLCKSPAPGRKDVYK